MYMHILSLTYAIKYFVATKIVAYVHACICVYIYIFDCIIFYIHFNLKNTVQHKMVVGKNFGESIIQRFGEENVDEFKLLTFMWMWNLAE